MKETLASGSLAPIGSVPEGDLIHVVGRANGKLGGKGFNKLEVVSVKRVGENWRVLLSGQMEAMTQVLGNTQTR